MATGGSYYPSTKERTNYGRLCRAIVDLSTDVLRDELHRNVSPNQLWNTVRSCADLKKKPMNAEKRKNINTAIKNSTYKCFDISFLYKLISAIGVQELRNELTRTVLPSSLWTKVQSDQFLMSQLNPEQVNKVKFVSTMGDYADVNCFLLSQLVKRFCPGYVPQLLPSSNQWGGNVPPQSADTELGDDIERIRHLRNKVYGHVTDTCVTDAEFQTVWLELKGIMNRMDQRLNTSGRYSTAINDIEKANLDDKWDEYILEIEELAKAEKDVQTDLRITKERCNTLEQKYTAADSRIEEMESQITSLDKKVEHFTEGYESYVPFVIKEQNKVTVTRWNEEDKAFIETRATKKVLDFVSKNDMLTLTGNAGTGKSATIHHVALLMKKEGYDILLVHTPDEMKRYLHPNKKQVFVVDDPVGVHTLDQQRFELWVQYTSFLQDLLKGNVKFLCSIRKQVESDLAFTNETCILNTNIISLQDVELNEKEKESMLIKHLEVKQCNIEVVKEVKRNMKKTTEEFPLICRLFSSDKDFQQHGVDFFLKPFGIILQNLNLLQEKDKTKYCTLLMCFVFENEFDPQWFDPFDGEEIASIKADPFMMACGVSRHDFVGALENNLVTLSCAYLKCQGNKYQFSHDLVYDVVSYHFGKKYPKQMLKFSPGRFISERVVLTKDAKCKDAYFIELKTVDIPLLLDRIIDDLNKGIPLHVMMNKCWEEDKFMDIFEEKFKVNQDSFMELFKREMSQNVDCTDQIKRDIDYLWNKNEGAQVWSWFYVTTDLLHIPEITLMHWAVVYAHKRLFQLLWQSMSPTEREKINHKIPLLPFASIGGDTEICASILHDTDCNVNTPCVYEDSVFGEKVVCEYWPLHLAAMKDVNITKFLLSKGADINAAIQGGARAGRTAFAWAAGFGNADILLLLLENSAVVTGGSIENATQNNRAKTMQVLTSHNISIDMQDNKGFTMLMLASQHGHSEIVQILLGYNAGVDVQNNEGCTALMLASRYGHADIVQILLSHNASVDMQNNEGWMALMLASRYGHVEIAQSLLSHNASVDMQKDEGWSALMHASRYGHVEIAQLLLSHNASVDMQRDEGWTALMLASRYGHVEIAQLLLTHSASVDMQKDEGWTALMHASCGNHAEIVQLLLSHNANVDMQKDEGWTALMHASRYGHVEIAQLLLSHNASVDMQNNEGWTALMHASGYSHAEIVQLLLSHNASVDMQDNEGSTALIHASRYGHTDIVQLLLSHNPNVDMQNNEGWTALIHASRYGHVEIAQLLLSHNASVDMQLDKGWTTLMLASRYGHAEIVQILLSHNASVDMQLDKGWTALMLASRYGHAEIVQILLSHNASVDMQNNDGWTALMLASRSGHVEIVQLLLSHNASVDMQKNDGWTALMLASGFGHAEIVQILLSQNVSVDMQKNDGWIALMLASRYGHAEIVQILLSHNISVDMQDNEGWTSLMSASRYGHAEIVQMLLSHNASVDMQKNDGWTALMHASRYGHVKIVQLLLSHNASVDMQKNDGWTALMLASRYGHVENAQLLLSHNASVDMQKDEGWTALMLASGYGHVENAQLLLRHNASVDMQKNEGWTALMLASCDNHAEIVKQLLCSKANIDVKNEKGETALLVARRFGHTQLVQMLQGNSVN